MADTKDKIFVQGLFVGERVFDWGKIGTLSIKVEEFKEFLDSHVNEKGYVNIDLRTTREGKQYAELNSFVAKTENTPPPTEKPATKTKTPPPLSQEPEDDDLPF